MVATPRRNPFVVRRSMSDTFPAKSRRPPSEVRIGVHRIAAPFPGAAHRGPDPEGAGDRAQDRMVLDLPAGPRRLRGGGDRADLGNRDAAKPLLPLPTRRALDDHHVVANVGKAEGIVAEVRDRESGHLSFGERAAHAVGVQDGEAGAGRDQETLERVGTADFEGHDGSEGFSEPLGEHLDRAGGHVRVGQPLLPDQGRSHRRNDRHQIIILERFGGDDDRPEPARGLRPQVQERVVGVPTAPCPEDPGPGGEVLDLGGSEFAGARGHAAGDASGSGSPSCQLGAPASGRHRAGARNQR